MARPRCAQPRHTKEFPMKTTSNRPGQTAGAAVPTRNLLASAAANGEFKVFADAVDKAGLTETLNGEGPFTVFAPTDAAFAQLPAGRLEALLKPDAKDELIAMLNYHVLKGRKTVAELGKWDSARTVQGQSAPIRLAEGRTTIDGANVSVCDVASSNGMLHGLDKVNIPTTPAASPTRQ
jgi:uncharacterized surface protein with fasciclin (FAS1) repeats